MFQSEECLKKERERVTHYLHSSSEPKLVEVGYDTLCTTLCNLACTFAVDEGTTFLQNLNFASLFVSDSP